MAINKNHEFEELDGVKCAVVEKNVTAERVSFLKNILAYNNFTVVVASTPPPKAAPPPKPAENEVAPIVLEPAAPETFTVGVTNVSFNSTNAIFGRQLNTTEGNIVTLAYWEQKDQLSNDEIPYFE